MSTVAEILQTKGSDIVTVNRKATVLDAAHVMNKHKVGAVVVMDEQNNVEGIFTERDLMQRVVAEGLSPAETIVEDVMSSDVVCCEAGASIDEARTVMRNRRIRHLPVVSVDGPLIGMVSIGDLNAWHLEGQEKTIHYLKEYLYGRV